MKRNILSLLFILWLAACAIGQAYDLTTIHERAASKIDAAVSAAE